MSNQEENVVLLSFESKWFLGDVERFKCGICWNVMYNPTQCKLKHNFCQNCLISAFKIGKSKCPICRVWIGPRTIKVDLEMKKQVESLTVKCNCNERELDFHTKVCHSWGQYKLKDVTTATFNGGLHCEQKNLNVGSGCQVRSLCVKKNKGCVICGIVNPL